MKHRGAWVVVLGLGLMMTFAIASRSASVWKALISTRYPGVEWVDGATLAKWMESPTDGALVLVDVRSPAEQRVSHLRGAEYIDPADPDVRALSIPKDAKVVVYCSIGYRSASVVSQLEQAGIREVYNLEGGLFEWANQDREVVRGDEQVREVHPYNRLWGLLLRPELRAAD